jgi:hypothetical protein
MVHCRPDSVEALAGPPASPDLIRWISSFPNYPVFKLQWLKEDDELRMIPIIAVTALP